MRGSKTDRVLEDRQAVAQTARRPEPRRGVAVRSRLFMVGTTVAAAALLLAAIILSQRLPAAGPDGSTPVVPGDSVAVDASASPPASAAVSPPAELEAHVVATIPGLYGTGCSDEPAVTEGALWILREGSVIKIDTDSNEVVAEIPVGLGSSPQIASGMGAVWVAPGYCEAGTPPEPMTVKRIDPDTNEIVASIPFDARGFLAASAVGVWVTIGTDPLTTHPIDTATNEPQPAFEVPVSPVAACGELWTWTGNSDGTQTIISRIDPKSGNPASTFTVETPNVFSLNEVGDECWGIIPIEATDPVVPPPSYLVLIDPGQGVIARSPDLPGTAFELGGSIWLRSIDSTTQTVKIQRIEPRTGERLGPSWILPEEVANTGLMYAEGAVWAQSSSSILRLDIKADN